MNVELLKGLGKVKQYKYGEFVCVEGEMGNTAYLLLEGKVEVRLGSFKDEPKTVAVLVPGAVFGEMSLLENKPRNASVVTATNTLLVLEIEKSNFLQILKSDKEIAYNLLKTLLGRMEKEMDEIYRVKLAYVAEIRRNPLFQQIKDLSCEQFAAIIDQDSEHALRLLKFVSHTLAEINQKNIN